MNESDPRPITNRPALLLLPGLLSDEAVWRSQINALANRVQCVVARYGSRDSLTAMAEAALEAAPAGFALAGHSMGGRVALEVMRLAPQRVRGLALLNTGYQPLPQGEAGETERRGRLRLLALARERGMRAMGEEWVQGMVHPDRLQDRSLIDSVLDMFERHTPDAFAAQVQALLQRPDGEPVLDMIRCPTLVLCGREDGWSPVPRHQAMVDKIAGARLAVIEHCGHMATLEQPATVSAAFAEWLARIS
ncbi:MAG: alpha/beta hydrolase [Proteobacteria bacterium]|nr:alpha/beta hydrolase [Pseudomonadota bacterium]